MKLNNSPLSSKNNGSRPQAEDKPQSSELYLQRKTTLTSESKDLLERLNLLKIDMQKNITSETAAISKENLTSNCEKNNGRLSAKHQGHTSSQKIDIIRQNIVGFNTRYISPFNIELQAVYVDHTATNRPYRTVEDLIKYAKKFVANPHTEFSHFGKYSTQMMHYAHDSLLRSFNADPDLYVALPTGSGSTGAIQKAIKIIKDFQMEIKAKPVIFLTPYQHHSNILPWVEFYDQIQVLSSDDFGNLVMEEVQQQLIKTPSQNLIVSISAASNVTSTLTDLKSLNQVIRKVRKIKNIMFSADCAAFCCHHDLNLKLYDQIDFAFLSPHKNLGGAEACGVLIAKKEIIKNSKPTFPGGGTVTFVKGYTKMDVMYDVDVFNRQIAGTPPFLGFYRAALSFQLLKHEIGYDFIHDRERRNTERFLQLINEGNQLLRNKDGSQIIIYGDLNLNKRANVITFNVLLKGKYIMQHNLVSLILADVFGIQLRSGCFCAGPFGMRLLKLDENTVSSIKEEVSVGILRDKPGYLRLDLTFYLELYEIQYIAKAILGVAQYSKNMDLVYTLCNDGQIKRHQLFKQILNNKYSLNNAIFAKQQISYDEATNIERLTRRHQTLNKQYERGMSIVSNPIKFLKSQYYGK